LNATGGSMQIFVDAWAEGWALLTSGSFGIWEIVWTSLLVSGSATAIALFIGLPVGYFVGAKRFIGRRAALVIFNAGMGLPPTVVGLIVAMTFSRRGPLGYLNLLYTRPAVVVAQLIIAVPVVMAITAAAVSSVPRELTLQARSLGANGWRVAALTLSEARMGLLAAVAGGFGAIISEVGAVQMVGGNLEGDTRVMTTAMVQFSRQGRYGPALGLAVVLMAIVIFVNIVLTGLQTSADRWERDGR
jgi:tungstate transport system permease protein